MEEKKLPSSDEIARQQWESSLNTVVYTGVWREDMLAVANSQIGYKESTRNVVQEGGELKDLREGDAVTFTDMDGITASYQVVAVDILESTAVEDMIAGEYDLTLFTCTYGGKSRVTVRCDRI